jgi:hypothetical protein
VVTVVAVAVAAVAVVAAAAVVMVVAAAAAAEAAAAVTKSCTTGLLPEALITDQERRQFLLPLLFPYKSIDSGASFFILFPAPSFPCAVDQLTCSFRRAHTGRH